jgi:50S ribosomal subunit-associated GTPase HflX
VGFVRDLPHKLVEAFENGVDDFMCKPLNQRVLGG